MVIFGSEITSKFRCTYKLFFPNGNFGTALFVYLLVFILFSAALIFTSVRLFIDVEKKFKIFLQNYIPYTEISRKNLP